MCLAFSLLACSVAVNNARIRTLEAKHAEVVVENQFLSRKLLELKNVTESETERRDEQLQFAVAGFRTGSWRAYQQILLARRSRREQEGVENALR
jgi:hypothetical protein